MHQLYTLAKRSHFFRKTIAHRFFSENIETQKYKIKLVQEEIELLKTNKIDRILLESLAKKMELENHEFSGKVSRKISEELSLYFKAETELPKSQTELKSIGDSNETYRQETLKYRQKVEANMTKMKTMNDDMKKQMEKVKNEGEVHVVEILTDTSEELSTILKGINTLTTTSNEAMVKDTVEGIRLIDGSIATVLRRFGFEKTHNKEEALFNAELHQRAEGSGKGTKIKHVLKEGLLKNGKVVKKSIVETD